MEDREHCEPAENLSAWVRGCADLLAPPADWEPNLENARARIESYEDIRWHRRSARKRYGLAAAAATAVVFIVVLALPQTSAFADQAASGGWRRLEEIWNWFSLVHMPASTMGRLADALKALHVQPTSKTAGPWVVSSRAEAAQRAGFTPRMPDPALLPAPAGMSVAAPQSFAATISAAELAEGLRKAGMPDEPVPRQWDGAQLTLQLAATVTCRWTGITDERGGVAWAELTLTQGPAPAVRAPSGVDVKALVSADLKAAGLRQQNTVTQLAQQASTAAVLLSGALMPYSHGKSTVRTASVRASTAALVEEFGPPSPNSGNPFHSSSPGVERITLAWTGPDRFYVLRGVPKASLGFLSPGLAAALTSMIDMARSID